MAPADHSPPAQAATAHARGDDASLSGHHASPPGAGHGHDDHPPAEPLGPPDVRAWGAALAGAGVAALMAIALFVATQA